MKGKTTPLVQATTEQLIDMLIANKPDGIEYNSSIQAKILPLVQTQLSKDSTANMIRALDKRNFVVMSKSQREALTHPDVTASLKAVTTIEMIERLSREDYTTITNDDYRQLVADSLKAIDVGSLKSALLIEELAGREIEDSDLRQIVNIIGGKGLVVLEQADYIQLVDDAGELEEEEEEVVPVPSYDKIDYDKIDNAQPLSFYSDSELVRVLRTRNYKFNSEENLASVISKLKDLIESVKSAHFRSSPVAPNVDDFISRLPVAERGCAMVAYNTALTQVMLMLKTTIDNNTDGTSSAETTNAK